MRPSSSDLGMGNGIGLHTLTEPKMQPPTGISFVCRQIDKKPNPERQGYND